MAFTSWRTTFPSVGPPEKAPVCAPPHTHPPGPLNWDRILPVFWVGAAPFKPSSVLTCCGKSLPLSVFNEEKCLPLS